MVNRRNALARALGNRRAFHAFCMVKREGDAMLGDTVAAFYAAHGGLEDPRYVGIHDYDDDFATYLFRDDDDARPHIALFYRSGHDWTAHRYDWTEDEIDASVRGFDDDAVSALRAMLPAEDVPAALVGTARMCVTA
jgi:hypothetical protein